jgi:hypothetical protein
MLASVLNSQVAVQASIQVVRAFIRLREITSAHEELQRKLTELEKRIEGHDDQIATLFKAIRQLMKPPEGPRKQIGFSAGSQMLKSQTVTSRILPLSKDRCGEGMSGSRQ